MARPCTDQQCRAAVWGDAALLVSVVALLLVPCAAVAEQVLAAPKLHRPAPPALPTLAALPSMPTLPPMPTMPTVYNCLLGMESDWLEAQQIWCCKSQQLGCQTTTETKTTTESTIDRSTTTADTSTTSAATSEEVANKRGLLRTKGKTTTTGKTTPMPTSTAVPMATTTRIPTTTTPRVETTTTNTCDKLCTVNSMAASCRDQIQQASLSDFLGSVDSCSLAQKVTAEQCPVCAGCLPHHAGCGIMELVTTPGPTTTIPKGDPCKAVCTLGGQPATCTARIMWSKDHIFAGKPNACKGAHDMVLHQCAVCSKCTVDPSTCEVPDPAATTEEELFDCTSGAAIEWSEAKAGWCCEHHERGCDVVPRDKEVFFQKKVAEAEAANSQQLLARRGRAVAVGVVGLGLFGSIILLFARSSSSAARRRRCFGHDRPDRLVLAE